MKPIYQYENVHFSLSDSEILKGMSGEIYREENFVYVGPTASGKSIWLRLLSGLLLASEGSISFEGEKTWFPNHKKIGMTFQHGGLFDGMTGLENLEFPLREKTELSQKEIRRRSEKLLDEVSLSGQGHLFPHEMSGGMKKRLAIARSLVLSPEILILDEPTEGLDPVTSRSIVEMIKALKENYPITLILSTSNPVLAVDLASRMGFLDQGKLEWTGTCHQLKKGVSPLIDSFFQGVLDLND